MYEISCWNRYEKDNEQQQFEAKRKLTTHTEHTCIYEINTEHRMISRSDLTCHGVSVIEQKECILTFHNTTGLFEDYCIGMIYFGKINGT